MIGATATGAQPFIVWAPPVFLTWPNGPVGAWEVWDAPLAATLAPTGVASESAKSALPPGFVGRVLAPIDRAGPAAPDPTEDGDG